jgi:DNA polymerase I
MSDHTTQDTNSINPPDQGLSEVHLAYLADHAITDDVALRFARSDGDDIVFSWRFGDQVTEQRRMWPEPEGGLDVKYRWEAGRPLQLSAWREVRGPVLLCEGTKQSLAVASWAPPEYSVYGMAGCRGWAGTDLSFFSGSQVIILLDADAEENLDVYEAGERLAAELELEGAFPFFVPSPAWGHDGIDDFLAERPEGRRTDMLQKLAERAVSDVITKPAPRRPTRRRAQVPDLGLPTVVVNDPTLARRDVIRQIMFHLQTLWSGKELFCYGGAITRLRDGKTEPLARGAFLRWLSEGVYCYKRSMAGIESCWPDNQTVEAVMASADEFALLERVVKMPFVRADGSVSAKNGYDAGAATFLAMGNSGMDRLTIADAPDQAAAREAAQRLLGDWLGDMPFLDQPSRAGALALVLTPFIRSLVPLVPLAVISGRQKGTGKNLFTDCFSIVMTGEPASPMQWIGDDDDEIRKQLLAAFREGRQLICFDEAHVIDSHALSRALTAQVYTDRLLGVSTMLSYPNTAVWMALGNNVQPRADMARRHHRIDLTAPRPNPEDRPSSDFHHPDLRGWTRTRRPELVTDLLVIIRAWFAAGCPAHDRGSLMGSFEQWDKMMSGILHYAGVPGFLDDMTRKREESDTSGGFWREHLAWIWGSKGDKSFTTIQVKQDAIASGGTWPALPNLDNLTDPGFARKLGQEYARHRDEWSGNLRLVKIGQGHGNVVRWSIQEFSEGTVADLGRGEPGGNDPGLPVGGNGGDGGNSHPPSHTHARAHDARAHAHTREGRSGVPSHPPVTPVSSLSFDLETGDASQLFTYQPHDDRGFVRLAGIIGPDGPQIMPAGDLLHARLESAAEITGHNILGFDLLALAWHYGFDWDRLAAKARDTELIARQANPPRSRETGGSLDVYDLDHVAASLGVPGKTDDIARLKAQHGGYDQIPVDDPEYRAYLEGDLRATQAVAALLHNDAYTEREHVLATLAGRMTLNGFAVDHELLARRLEQGQQRKADALALLHDAWGLPLGKAVMRGRGSKKHEEFELAESPLATDFGRDWLEKFWERYGVHDPPRTVKADKLAIGNDDLAAVAARPNCPGDMKAALSLMGIVTGTRTVYQTATDCLAPDGRVHPVVSMRQASGRWSVTNPGLTVFGKRGGKHVEREVFLPDPGHVLLSFDLSQVDMRAIAGHCQDPAYMALFEPGRDAHTEIARQVGIERQDAKAIGHGWNYGLGAKRMIANGLDPELVHAFTTGMEQRFPALMAWREQIRAEAGAGMVLDNGFGRRMRADPARAYTVAPALLGQGGARDIMCESLLHLPRELWPMLRVMVHDEILLSVPKADAMDVARVVKQAMTWSWRGVPILCDMAAGVNWGECSEH